MMGTVITSSMASWREVWGRKAKSMVLVSFTAFRVRVVLKWRVVDGVVVEAVGRLDVAAVAKAREWVNSSALRRVIS